MMAPLTSAYPLGRAGWDSPNRALIAPTSAAWNSPPRTPKAQAAMATEIATSALPPKPMIGKTGIARTRKNTVAARRRAGASGLHPVNGHRRHRGTAQSIMPR